jgi:hypothetical protein
MHLATQDAHLLNVKKEMKTKLFGETCESPTEV